MTPSTSCVAQLGVDNEKYCVLAYVTNVFNNDKVQSAQSYGDPSIASPVAPPVLADTTFPADPKQVRRACEFPVLRCTRV